MPESRKRRIVKRTLLVAAVLMLMPASYVSSWLVTAYALGRGWIDGPRFQRTEDTVFRPIQSWRQADRPGSVSLYHWYNIALHAGRDIWLEENRNVDSGRPLDND